ncbi:MAG: DNA polymerase/3'-5' exonuclease PolX [Candidatus Rokubacteria bacterium]|nr:DNA polymerase/3'-5' exonuclease PolX [Candidatus Rokubacteria bacterium]MBI3826112.1 DNA polymerase/3'-5' exonuclease PolX [Candidatus Rokubacteria bacterium]
MKNFDVARLFSEMATLLEVNDESVFRVRAYQRAARTLEALPVDVAEVAARGGLTDLPGIGRDLAARVEEYLATGRIEQLERLRGGLPASFVDLLEIRGLGPKTARLLYDRLGVHTVERLEELCRSREILAVAGIRDKTRANILKGIAQWRAGRTRTLLSRARGIAEQLVQTLTAHGGVDRIEIAGSLRRMKETVKDIDILVTSTEPARVIETFASLPSVLEVVARGDTKVTVRHPDGLHVDLRVVAPDAFGAALQYFTGSKEHNVRVREMAVRRGLRVSEYGVFEEATGRKIAGRAEAEVYEAVGLPWIPPELREDAGEIEAAREGRLPELVTRAAICGDLHAHTDWSDGHHPLERLIEAAQARGYEYVIVSDHSQSLAIANGLTPDRLREQLARIRALQPRYRIRILAGCECDILADGSMDFPDDLLAELDVVLAAVHSRFRQDRGAMTARIVRALANPHVDILAHPTGRLIGSREPSDVDMEAVLAAALRHGKAVEINASPDRLDLKDTHARRAAELGVPIAISTDTHHLSHLDFLDLGLAVARRAWITSGQVLNARPLDALLAWTHRSG